MHPLRHYLAHYHIHVDRFAKTVGCSSIQIYRIMSGTRYPSRSLALRIEEATDGVISTADLLTYNIDLFKEATPPPIRED